MDINNADINKALKKMNVGESVQLLNKIVRTTSDVYDNQTQVIPALINIYKMLEYQNRLLKKLLDERKLGYDEAPKPVDEKGKSFPMDFE